MIPLVSRYNPSSQPLRHVCTGTSATTTTTSATAATAAVATSNN